MGRTCCLVFEVRFLFQAVTGCFIGLGQTAWLLRGNRLNVWGRVVWLNWAAAWLPVCSFLEWLVVAGCFLMLRHYVWTGWWLEQCPCLGWDLVLLCWSGDLLDVASWMDLKRGLGCLTADILSEWLWPVCLLWDRLLSWGFVSLNRMLDLAGTCLNVRLSQNAWKRWDILLGLVEEDCFLGWWQSVWFGLYRRYDAVYVRAVSMVVWEQAA